MARQERTIAQADFNARVVNYIVINAAMICTLTIIGIPALPVVVVLTYLLAKKYFGNLRCELTDRNLQIDKGVLVRTESTIPLDKITDVQMVQGPLMRAVGIHGLKVETAGQSAGASGATGTLLGVVDARAFRDLILTERDRVTDTSAPAAPAASPAGELAASGDVVAVLGDIRDTLARIERGLADRS